MKNYRIGQILRNDVTGNASMSCLSRAAVIALLVGFTYEASAQSIDFDIVAQPTDDTLLELAETAGIQIAFAADRASKSTSPPIMGLHSVEEALDEALQGTGLDYQFANADFVVVTEDDVLGVQASTIQAAGARYTSHLAQLQATSNPSSSEINRPSNESATGVVTGKVTDARTGANLKGAKVTIEETGQWTSTNDLGVFRFVNVPTGSATLTVSYLGYAGQSAAIGVRSGSTSQDFTLRGGSEIEEIVVFGQRSARALALNQERTARNVSTVLSSDLLGQFGGKTIAESLRRAPGISFQRNFNTGDGTNVSVRGLAPDLNVVKLNGVELPDGSGVGRSASLENLLTESIDKIVISKSLLPSQDSGGTGGLIEVETKSPLDRPRRYAFASLDAAQRQGDFYEDVFLAGTISSLFGERESFGLSASLQYRDNEVTNVNYSTDLLFGEYLPLQVDGSTNLFDIDWIDPRRAFPFESGASGVYPSSVSSSYSEVESENLTLTLSSAWQLDGHTTMRLDYQRVELDQRELSRNTTFSPLSSYSVQPVQALNGEPRQALGWTGEAIVAGAYTLVPNREQKTELLSFHGASSIDSWSLRYNLGYTKGQNKKNEYFLNIQARQPFSDPALVQANATDPTEGRIVSLYEQRENDAFPLPLLTQAGFGVVNDPANYGFGGANLNRVVGENERHTARVSARYDARLRSLSNIEMGVDYEESQFSSPSQDATLYRAGFDPATFPSLSSLGVVFADDDLGAIGVTGGFRAISSHDVERFLLEEIDRIAVDLDPNDPSTSAPGVINRDFSIVDPRLGATRTEEEEFAAYVQAQLDIGKIEVVGGIRLSQVDVAAVTLNGPRIFDEFFVPDTAFEASATRIASETASKSSMLPRLLANYRFSEKTMLRLGYFKTVARPQVELIQQDPNINLVLAPFFGPNFNQRALFVQKGNPDLQPAETDNYDVSLEHFDDMIGVIKVGAFYKRIAGLLESNIRNGVGGLADVSLPDDSRFQDVIDNPDDYFVQITIPQNNQSPADIWGVEIAVERQFTQLPGAWGGLGMYANYAYTESSKEQPVDWFFRPVLDNQGNITSFENEEIIIGDVRFNDQPDHSGTFGITYNWAGLDANISYTSQSRYQEFYVPHNRSQFTEDYSTLDARAEYRFDFRNADVRVFLEATDLLRGTRDAGLQRTSGTGASGTGKYYTNAFYYGGRQVRIGVSGVFREN